MLVNCLVGFTKSPGRGYWRVKRPRCETDYSSPSSIPVKECMGLFPLPAFIGEVLTTRNVDVQRTVPDFCFGTNPICHRLILISESKWSTDSVVPHCRHVLSQDSDLIFETPRFYEVHSVQQDGWSQSSCFSTDSYKTECLACHQYPPYLHPTVKVRSCMTIKSPRGVRRISFIRIRVTSPYLLRNLNWNRKRERAVQKVLMMLRLVSLCIACIWSRTAKRLSWNVL